MYALMKFTPCGWLNKLYLGLKSNSPKFVVITYRDNHTYYMTTSFLPVYYDNGLTVVCAVCMQSSVLNRNRSNPSDLLGVQSRNHDC